MAVVAASLARKHKMREKTCASKSQADGFEKNKRTQLAFRMTLSKLRGYILLASEAGGEVVNVSLNLL